MFYSVFFLRIY